MGGRRFKVERVEVVGLVNGGDGKLEGGKGPTSTTLPWDGDGVARKVKGQHQQLL